MQMEKTWEIRVNFFVKLKINKKPINLEETVSLLELR